MIDRLKVLLDGIRSWSARQKERRSEIRERILSVVTTCLLIFAIGVFFFVVVQTRTQGYVNVGGRSLFRVVTGSMEPTIARGALLMSRETPIEALAEGDVICYRSRQGDTSGWIITHRVVAIRSNERGEIVLSTKGDANSVADPQEVHEEDLIGRVVWYTQKGNGLAAFLSFLNSGFGFLALIAVPGFLIASLLLVRSIKSVREELGELSKALAEEKKEDTPLVPVQGLSAEEYEQLKQEVLAELLAEREELMREVLETLRKS